MQCARSASTSRGRVPHKLDRADVEWADLVVTMGCGDACPVLPGKSTSTEPARSGGNARRGHAHDPGRESPGSSPNLPASSRARAASRRSRRALAWYRTRPRRSARASCCTATTCRSSIGQLPRAAGALLDQAQAEMDVSGRSPFVGGAEDRPTMSSDRRPYLVQRARRGADRLEVGEKLRRALADCRPPYLLESARPIARGDPLTVAGRALSRPRSSPSCTKRPTAAFRPDAKSRGQELQEPSSSSASRRSAGASVSGSSPSAGSSERNSSWRRSRKRSTPSEHADGVALAKRVSSRSTSLQHRASIRPLRVDELQREIRRAAPSAQPLLFRDRVDPSTTRPARAPPIAAIGRV